MTVFKNLIGQRITAVFLGDDDTSMVFRTTEGKYFFYQTRVECCNTVWVTHIAGVGAVRGNGNSFDLLRGALVTGGEDKEWTENRDGEDPYEVIQDGFYTLHTDRGYVDIEVRNSHNGYYGGDFEEAEILDLSEIADLREIVEDF